MDVISLLLPAIPCGIKRWGVCSGEERRRSNDFVEPKHGVGAQKCKEVVNATDLDIIQNQ
jgi:hypothetical protein